MVVKEQKLARNQNPDPAQSGMVSIVVTMIMILVISLIVLGFAQVARNNQRSALDKQLSTQAFYAAETGINDAKEYIQANRSTPTTTACNDFITTAGLATKSKLSADGDVAYTCLTVNNNPKTLRFQAVTSARSTVTPLFSPVAVSSLVFSWQANSSGSFNSANCSINQGLPPLSGGVNPWNCAYGLLRVDLMPETNATGAAALGGLTRSFYFKPSNAGSGLVAVSSFSDATQRGTLVPVRCDTATRTCRATLNLSGTASTSRYYARLSSEYRDARNVVISSNSPNVSFGGSQVVIDSTGRAQDVLRRLQVRVPLVNTSAIATAAITSTGEICKRISVESTAATNTCPGGVVTGGIPPTTVGIVMDKIDVGNYHVCANSLAGDGFCWGKNDFGQLGNGTNNNTSTPFGVTTAGVLSGKVLVGTAAGYNHTCVVDAEGKVYCWGYNSQGQLGNGRSAIDNNPFPTAVVTTGSMSGKRIIKVNAGDSHTCALSDDGVAYCWGGNIYGQLGTGSTANSFVPTPVNTSGVLRGKTIVDISAGYQHTCAVTSDGRAYCWGFNSHGQLGNGTLRDSSTPVAVAGGYNFKRITAGHHHTCAITISGEAYCWGNGEQGRLGNGSANNSSVPVAVSTNTGLAGKQVSTIAAGFQHTCAIASGLVYCWGLNSYGQLGNGAAGTDQMRPVAVLTTGAFAGKLMSDIATGQYSSCSVASTGEVYCWGKNDDGQLGDGARPVDSAQPVFVTIR